MEQELNLKLQRIRTYMSQNGYDAFLLGNNENFCWLSCGHYAFVDKSSPNAVAKLLITADKHYVITNSSEQFRIPQEELCGMGFIQIAYPWHGSEAQALRPYLEGKRVASDNSAFGTQNCAAAVVAMRAALTDSELARYREIGPVCAAIVEEQCRVLMPGQSEYQIAGEVTGKLMAAGFQVPVCLVAADERLLTYRHPLPTAAAVKRRAMIAICAQKYGLTISMSRIVSFGMPDESTRQKYDALLKVDATYILSTITGAKAGDIVQKGHAAYAQAGYEADFHLHHQGGALGYLTRDYCANESDPSVVQDRQAFSWNPTIAGVKLEDTYIVMGDQQEILTQTAAWPNTEVTVEGKRIRRPLILVR